MNVLRSTNKVSYPFWQFYNFRTCCCTLVKRKIIQNRSFETFSSADNTGKSNGVFDSKTTLDLLRSIVVLKLCSSEFLVDKSTQNTVPRFYEPKELNHCSDPSFSSRCGHFYGGGVGEILNRETLDVLQRMGEMALGKKLFDTIMRRTFYKQFVGGEKFESLKTTSDHLKQAAGIRAMVLVPTEEDVSSESENFSKREAMFDRNKDSILNIIKGTDPGSALQVKITAICSPVLMVSLHQLLTPFETSGHKPKELSIEQFARGLDTPVNAKTLIPQLSEEQNIHLCNSLRRLNIFAEQCLRKGLKLVVDAEMKHMQAAANHFVLALQYKYNRMVPLVYNTYQCYRKDTYDRVTADLKQMEEYQFHFGAKLVRGAYMEFERAKAKEMGYEDPICESYEATSNMYKKCLDSVLEKVASSPAEVMVASHNENTVDFAVQRMKEYEIERETGRVCFGQTYGMCDHVSFSLGQNGFIVYKSIPYGPLDETISYLIRRAQENKSVTARTEKERALLWEELKRRMLLKPKF